MQTQAPKYDFNQSLMAPIKEAISSLELEILEAETRLKHSAAFRILLQDPSYKSMLDDLKEVEQIAIDRCCTKHLGSYEQGRYQGLIHAVRLLTKQPFRDDQEEQTLIRETLPALREKLAEHRRLLGVPASPAGPISR